MGSFERQRQKDIAYLDAEKKNTMDEIIAVESLEEYFEYVLSKENQQFDYNDDDFVL